MTSMFLQLAVGHAYIGITSLLAKGIEVQLFIAEVLNNVSDGTVWTNRTYNFTTQAPQYRDLYFDDASDADQLWDNDPDKMIDGNISTYAFTDIDNDVQLLDSNTMGLVPDDAVITNVYIRAYGYKTGGGNPNYVNLRPVFDGTSDGDNHVWYPPVGAGSAAWSSYFDITNDTNAPDPWYWSNVTNLDCDVEAVVVDDIVHYCAKVDIRVKYYTED